MSEIPSLLVQCPSWWLLTDIEMREDEGRFVELERNFDSSRYRLILLLSLTEFLSQRVHILHTCFLLTIQVRVQTTEIWKLSLLTPVLLCVFCIECRANERDLLLADENC